MPPMKKTVFVLLFSMVSGFSMPGIALPQDGTRLQELRKGGGFPKWSAVTNRIAYTERIDDQYEIFTITPSGEDAVCLTAHKDALRNCGHRGQPYWHPNGDYIVFTAQNSSYRVKGNGVTSAPGIGRNHNIWIMSSDGDRFGQITDYPEDWGAIRPSFSHDGTMICWSEEYSKEKYLCGSFWGWLNLLRPGEELGLWRIRFADISFDGNKVAIDNVRVAELPEGFSLLECEGFTPDDDAFIVSACDLSENNNQAFWGDIYLSLIHI